MKKKLKKPTQSFVDFKIEKLKADFAELDRERDELNKYLIKNSRAIDKIMAQFSKWHKIKREGES